MNDHEDKALLFGLLAMAFWLLPALLLTGAATISLFPVFVFAILAGMTTTMNRHGRWALDMLCAVLAILAGVYLAGIMLGIVVMVIARQMDISGWPSHIFSFSEFGLLYIVMAASPWLVRHRGHVFIELVSAAVPKGWQRPYSRVISTLCIVICVVLVWYTWGATAKAYKFGDAEMRSLDMPKFLLLGAMPICFGLMAIQFSRFVWGPDTLHSGQAGVHE